MVKVLVADDSILTRTMLRNILIEDGYQVDEVVNGNEAVSRYDEIKPDLVLMDLVMPVKDGLSAIKDIISKDSSAKIIVCSADVQDLRVSEAIEAGACDYITKPFDKEKILAATEKCLKISALDEVRQDVTTERAILKDFFKNGTMRGIQALSRMLNKNVKVSISDFRSIELPEIPGYIGTECIGVNYRLKGTNTGRAALLIPRQFAYDIVCDIMRDISVDTEGMVSSVFNEIGNVFINSFLSTFSDLLDLMISYDALEEVTQDTILEELNSVEFASPAPQAYMLKGNYFIDNLEFYMFLILYTDIKSICYKYDLKDGMNYLVNNDRNSEKSFDMFKYMIKRGYNGLCITKRHPDDVRKLVGNGKLPLVWLSTEDVKIPNCVCITNLPKISKVVQSFYGKVNKIILLIDDIEYLVDNNSKGIVNGFIEEIKSKNIHDKNILIIPSEPAYSEKEYFNQKNFEIIR
jgi:two-component system chemotaxis response regulator CheY